MPCSLNHESEQEPSKWVYAPSSMGYEGENRTKREAPTRKGQEHAARETKTAKVNSIMRLHIRSWNIIILIIMVITIGLFYCGTAGVLVIHPLNFTYFLTAWLRDCGSTSYTFPRISLSFGLRDCGTAGALVTHPLNLTSFSTAGLWDCGSASYTSLEFHLTFDCGTVGLREH